MMGDWGWSGGWMAFHGLTWVIVLALIIAGVVLLVRGLSNSGASEPLVRRPRGLEALEERYARGEIKRDEFLEKKQDLLG
jgi:putative membrane protein